MNWHGLLVGSILGVAVISACGAQVATSTSGGGVDGSGATVPPTNIVCMDVTTIPGQTTRAPDPATCETVVPQVLPVCDDAPLVAPSVDGRRWLDGEAMARFVLAEETKTDDVDPAWLDEVPTQGLAVTARESSLVEHTACATDESGRAVGRTEQVTFDLEDAARFEVTVEQLFEPLDPFNLASETDLVDLDDGGQLIRSDLFGDGSFLTVWLVRPDGVLVKIRSAGANAPDVAGFPTTIPQPQLGPRGPAMFDLDELEAVARAVLAAIPPGSSS